MNTRVIRNGFLLLFASVVIGQLLPLYNIQFNFEPYLYTLTILALLCGGLILFSNPDALIHSLEKTGKENGDHKWGKMNWYIIALTIIVIAGILFRLVKINDIGIYFDEYRGFSNALGTQDHGVANFFLDEKWSQNEPRFRCITWAIGWLFSVFGKSLIVARLPGIIMSSLTAIPLYFLMSRINRKAGLTAAALWFMSPWAIAIGRFFREYAYFPFYYVLVFVLLLWVIEYAISIIRKEVPPNRNKIILAALILVLPIMYAFTIGYSTTFKLVVIPYAVGLLYFVYLFLITRKKGEPLLSRRGWEWVTVTGIAILLCAIGIFARDTLNIVPHFEPEWVRMALENGPRNWFYRTGSFSFFLLSGLGILGSLTMVIHKKNPSAFFMCLITLGYMYIFTFHFNFTKLPRYTFPIHLWAIPILVLGIQVLYSLLSGIKENWKKMVAYGLFILTLGLTFNPVNTYGAINMVQMGRDEITGEYLHKFDKVARLYGEKLKDAPVLCWTCHPLFWFDLADISENRLKIFRVQSPNSIKDILNFMDDNKNGWMILDAQRYKKNFAVAYEKNKWSKKLPTTPPEEDIPFEGRVFRYVDNINGFYLYRW